MNHKKIRLAWFILYSLLLGISVIIAGCDNIALFGNPVEPDLPTPQATPTNTLSEPDDPVALTLNSLEKVDEHPLYIMHYYAEHPDSSALYDAEAGQFAAAHPTNQKTNFSCSLFAALGDPDSRVYGRNFDWQFSPALLLFTHPANGFESVSMVDIAYLGFDASSSLSILDLPLEQREPLLGAPLLPFDGMNEEGLSIAMAAVSDSEIPIDPQKETTGSLMIMRRVLDNARDMEQALQIFEEFNIDFTGGPHLHYLLADRFGESAVVEYHNGEMLIHRNPKTWQQVTNFPITTPSASDNENRCWRYDSVQQEMESTNGNLSSRQAMQLLEQVAQSNTQWSVVYNLSRLGIDVTMGSEFEQVYSFSLLD